MTGIPTKDVLIVDDDDAIRQLLQTTLKRAGLTCETATDGIDALEHLSATVYRVVLLDLMMPRLDGTAMLQRLRSLELPHGNHPMVFVLTATMNREALAAVSEMVQVVIRKPFDLPALRDLVHDCIATQSDRGAGSPRQKIRRREHEA